MPFDTRDGWYAATKQTLPSFGGVSSFDSSGRVTSFHLCNVGPNGREQFFEGFGDDICQLINLNTGQPLGFFPGLDERTARQKVSQAIQAIQDASSQHGSRIVRINGRDMSTGSPAANVPSVQCQDFMSPKECTLLFNVCDPVICPASRCDFGGKFPVADVIQTGIVGSALLCLPNAQENIAVPVCLTGIHAGIDGFVSIMKSHQSCLQESLETGRTVGICDQLYSVYLCEFFWRQVAPMAQVILPKIVEFSYGQGTRGGGEYLTTMGAWQNTQESISYFTQSYAANSINAFQIRSVEEAGGQFCQAFTSVKAPGSLEALIEPDSPPQYHAWFSSSTFSDATVPATAQYKVFYHIFAGNDQGSQFRVYLKNPPENSFFSVPQTVQVATGFVGRGEFAQESRDFTAPEGYQELCVQVNNQEECGFGRVSTSFALDYLQDQYVGGELERTGITSEAECISGGVTLNPGAGIAAVPSAQGVLENSITPQVQQRGIVRICSSQNPGSKTDPTRFSEVGTCGEESIKCWLDKESVNTALSDNSVGIAEDTLEAIEEEQLGKLNEQGFVYGEDVGAAEIKELEKRVSDLRSQDQLKSVSVNETISRLNAVFDRVLLNHQKAHLLYMVGDLRALWFERQTRAVQKTQPVVPPAPTPEETPEEESDDPEQVTEDDIVFALEDFYDPAQQRTLLVNGQQTNLYFLGNGVFIQGNNAIRLGSVTNGKITFLETQKAFVNQHIVEQNNGIVFDYVSVLEKRVIVGTEFQADTFGEAESAGSLSELEALENDS